MDGILALQDGRIFRGEGFGFPGETIGELVFNTSITGYQEILSDPSYAGQIVAMTYPLIGNYGVNRDDMESRRPFLQGFVVGEHQPAHSNWRSEQGLGAWLAEHGIPGLAGIDTRALTRHLRDGGCQMACLSTVDADPASVLAKARQAPSIDARNLLVEVTSEKPFIWQQAVDRSWQHPGNGGSAPPPPLKRLVVYDFGVKRNILRNFCGLVEEIRVVPATTPAADCLALQPDAVFLSNGPGNPDSAPAILAEVKRLIGRVPLFGICMGHQLLGLALGAKTRKLTFGHHGGNHPVQHLASGRVEITAQNHNYAVDADTLPAACEVTHRSLFDQSCEGFRHAELPIMAVQYHPEASPGPQDSLYLFPDFVRLVHETR